MDIAVPRPEAMGEHPPLDPDLVAGLGHQAVAASELEFNPVDWFEGARVAREEQLKLHFGLMGQ